MPGEKLHRIVSNFLLFINKQSDSTITFIPAGAVPTPKKRLNNFRGGGKLFEIETEVMIHCKLIFKKTTPRKK